MTITERTMVGRAASVAILLLVLGAVWIGPVSAYLGQIGTGTDQIASKEALLRRYRALAEAATSDKLAPTPSDSGLLFPEIPDSQAIALLQETIKSAAAAAQIQVRGMQVLRMENLPGTARIGIRVSASGDIASLGRLLYAVEAARPLLYPDNLNIQSRAGSAAAVPASLEFQFDVSGFKAGGS